jgi:hypothetical protein
MLDVNKMLLSASKITDRYEQANAYREVIRALCAAGLFEEAWETILPDTGFNRSVQLGVFFYHAHLSPEAALNKINKLVDVTEKKGSISAYLARNASQLSALLQDANFKQLFSQLGNSDPTILVDIIGNALRGNFDEFSETAEKKEKANALLLEYQKKGLVSDSVLATMVVRNHTKDPSELWKWFANTTMGIDSPEPFDLQVREGVVHQMVAKNPSQALKAIVENKNVNAAQDIYAGLYRWTKLDPGAASKWYENQKPDLSTEQADHAAKAFAKSAIEFSELDGAQQWASKITNQRIRESVVNEIEAKFTKGR